MSRKRYHEDRESLDPAVTVSSGLKLTQSQILTKTRINNNGCWIWPKTDKAGYPHPKVHRRSYELWQGPIPKGAEIDHKCRVRACVNPAHLRLTNRSFNSHLRETAKRGGFMSAKDRRVASWLHQVVGEKLLEDYGAEGSV